MASTMSDAAKAARREYKRVYMRKWRSENRDKVAENNRRYWERKATMRNGGAKNAEAHDQS